MRFDYAAYEKMVALERKYTAPKTNNTEAAVEPIEENKPQNETESTEEGGANDIARNGESTT